MFLEASLFGDGLLVGQGRASEKKLSVFFGSQPQDKAAMLSKHCIPRTSSEPSRAWICSKQDVYGGWEHIFLISIFSAKDGLVHSQPH